MHIDIIVTLDLIMLGANAQLWQMRLHSKIANLLLENSWQQTQVAQVLGTTQSTISRWNERPVIELASQEDNLEIDLLAATITSELLKNGIPDKIAMGITIGEEISKCNLSMIKKGKNATNNLLINSMSRLINKFSELPKCLIPAVGINIASCSKEVIHNSEVIAFPGRLRLEKGKLLAQMPPQIGASMHLANVLLSLRETGSDAIAIINLKLPNEDIINNLSNILKVDICDAPRGIPQKNSRILVDRGDFGWEPSLYLATNNIESIPRMVNELILIC
ncbi:MAG: thiamine-phosphate synthase family protein [Candidatus Poseidoniales archaeon]|jgi:predicted fused transcriptional regulator/phosphomethylpyrimidine kinase|tara:strand:+ start:75 stop:908 length:834 start_codon:yes stop_codon:yes gene_type:complete